MLVAKLIFTIASVLSVADNRKVHITADRASQDIRANMYSWSGNVVVSEGPYKLIADDLVLQLNSKGQPCTLKATGSPVLASGPLQEDSATASGEVVLYDCNTETVRVSGNAVLTSGTGDLTADHIIYRILQQNIRAQGGSSQRTELRLEP